MAQIIGYLTKAEKERFKKYAKGLDLDASALANLLIRRELEIRRLVLLYSKYHSEEGSADREKITGHQSSNATKRAFEKYVAGLGFRPTPSAAVLFRAELSERWLQKTIQKP